MSRAIVVTSWGEFQHYKDRDPPWIKLYRDTLTSEVWLLGTDLSRLVQVASTLLAARYKNKTPLNFELWKKVAHLDCSEAAFNAAIEHLVAHKFLSIQELDEPAPPAASRPLATRNTPGDVLYSEGEQSREEKSRADTRGREAPEGKGSSSAPRGTGLNEALHELVAKIQAIYPRGMYTATHWITAERALGRLLDEGETPERLVAAAEAYRKQQQAIAKIGTQYILAPSKFYGEGHWRDAFGLPIDPKAEALAAWDQVLAYVRTGAREKTPGGKIDAVVSRVGGYALIGGTDNSRNPAYRNRFVDLWPKVNERGEVAA